MIPAEWLAPISLALVPFTVILYNILKRAGITKPRDAKMVESAWQQAIREGEIHPTNDCYDTLYEIFVDGIGKRPDEPPDYLSVASGGFGAKSMIYSVSKTGDEGKKRESLVPLALADKWIKDHIEGRQQQVEKYVYGLAMVLLFFGLFLELYVPL